MIQSMTGFGSAEREPFKVEIRSVNHRFIDISAKLPQTMGGLEIELRNRIRERFARGRFDVLVTLTGEGAARVKINTESARAIHQALLSLRENLSLEGGVSVDTLAAFRDHILSEDREYSTGPFYESLQDALERLREMRLREGGTIARDLSSRISLIEGMAGEIDRLCPDAVSIHRERFAERLRALFGEAQYDENRILQEAAIAAEKTDIAEEITRFNSHISQLRKILGEDDAVGRKIEFILQELNREVNTIASKATDYRISSIAVEMKAELEKMREQAQNIQ
jgi:uncharacterized protein (TIGR00255 family)